MLALNPVTLQEKPQLHGVIADLGVAVERLRPGGAADKRVGRAETAEAVDVGAEHRVVVARFGVALVAGELPFRSTAALIPRFAERIMPLLSEDCASSVRSGPHPFPS